MEEILVKVASILDMSVEGLVEYYPVIREQLMVYNILSNISFFLICALLTSPLIMFFGAMILEVYGAVNIDKHATKKNFKRIGAYFIVLIVLLFLCTIGKSIFAKDLAMLKQLL